jgi:lipopolysaccharide heptosyltransferase II
MSPLVGPWAGARRILAVRLDALGDVVMTTPALRALAGSHAETRLTLLTSPAGATVAPLIESVDDVIVHDVPWMKPRPSDGAGPDDGAAERALVERLRTERFDGAVIFTVHTQSALPAALLCHLAGIPLRLAHSRENPYRLLTDWVAEPEPDAPLRHEVRRQLDLVATIGATSEDDHVAVRVPADAARRVRARLAAAGLSAGRPWVLIAPGATASSRRYPADRFAAAARILATEHGWQVVVVGTAEERNAVRLIADAAGSSGIALPGLLDVGELTAAIAAAPVLIANNSGPSHLGAAVGTPVVTLYALTNLQHAPWTDDTRVLANDVPCKGCRRSVCPAGHHACLRGIPPQAVAEAAVELRAGRPAIRVLPAGILGAGSMTSVAADVQAAAVHVPAAAPLHGPAVRAMADRIARGVA